jgi:ABC-2 type transport system ATP-binding protein
MDIAVRTWQLAKSYRRRPALDRVDLTVDAGVVFGYLGPNGAGKTTTIRLLTGLIRPTAGRAEVRGHDVVRSRAAAQRCIGYVPGEFTAYPDLTAGEYLRYLSNLRRDESMPAAELLAKRLDLDLDGRIGAMSHGNRQKVGIVQAFMHRPDVLILDEPTIGLDPLVQHEFLGLIREARDAGRTVFLSSHDLFEVEAVADTVAILRRGRVVVQESVQKLKEQAVRRMDLTFAGPPSHPVLAAVPAVREVTVSGRTAHLVVTGTQAELFTVAARYGIDQVVTHEPDLEDIFLAYYQREG